MLSLYIWYPWFISFVVKASLQCNKACTEPLRQSNHKWNKSRVSYIKRQNFQILFCKNGKFFKFTYINEIWSINQNFFFGNYKCSEVCLHMMVSIGDIHLLGTLSQKFEKNIPKMTPTRKNGLFLDLHFFEKMGYFPEYARKRQNIFLTKLYMSQDAPKKFWASYLHFWQNYRKFLGTDFFFHVQYVWRWAALSPTPPS